MTKKKNSLIKDNPLQKPGRLLDKEIDKILGDDTTHYIIIPIFCIVLTSMEWWRWYCYGEQLPSPIILTFMTLIVTIFSIYKLFRHKNI